jgi:hypothetical protein
MPTEAQKRALSYGPQPDIAAASLRAAIRGEILPITVTTSSKQFAVPASWKGCHVRMHADGGNVYYQISTGADAACDLAARAVETGTPAVLTPSASGNGCMPIPNGASIDVPFPADANTFALIGSAACVLRCHLAET